MTPRDNFINFFTNKEYEWIPTTADEKYFYPEMIPENVARGFVIQQKPFPREKFGGNDWFSIHWTFYPEAAGMGGSMEDYSLFDDANDWKICLSKGYVLGMKRPADIRENSLYSPLSCNRAANKP